MTTTHAPGTVRTYADDLPAAAAQALACLDLTSLGPDDSDDSTRRLCERASAATGPRGGVPAVCVWPRFAALARASLPDRIAVAAVANFPDGSDDIARAVADTRTIVCAGAQEVDVVLPWRRLLAGDEATATALLQAVREACPGLRLKVILETGELGSAAAVATASRLALGAGADFIKTSTGMTPTGASLDATALMLAAIADDAGAKSRAGLKPSGGIRTVAEAARYLDQFVGVLGADALGPQRFRIGASSLLNDIEAVLAGTAPAAGSSSGY